MSNPSIMPTARQRYYTNEGVPASGCLLYTYAAGTTTNKATYSDAAGTVPNTNPIVLDAKGEAVIYWDGNYKVDLKTAAGVQTTGYPVDNYQSFNSISANLAASAGAGLVGAADGASGALFTTVAGFIATILSSAGASLMGFIQAGVGAVMRSLQSKARETISVLDFGAIPDFNGAIGTDNSVALQNAINYCSSIGGQLLINGRFLHSATLIFANNVTYKGVNGSSGIISSQLYYTGVADQIQVNNPKNSSTAAYYKVEDILISSKNQNTGKACFADLGSSIIKFKGVNFSGNAFGLILDQSEILEVSGCTFVNQSTAGAWLVNGASRTPGALLNYTNQITFRNNQINESSTCIGIADDGGSSHSYFDNDFNGCSVQLRLHDFNNVIVDGANEFEGCTSAAVRVSFLDILGSNGVISQNLTLNNALILGASNGAGIHNCLFDIESGALQSLHYCNNTYYVAAGAMISEVPFSQLAITPSAIFATGNRNVLGGATPYNNYNASSAYGVLPAYVPVWGAGGAAPSIGNGTLNGTWSRNGVMVQCSGQLIAGSTTNFGTSNYTMSIPVVEGNGSFTLGHCILVHAGTEYVGVCHLSANGTTMQFNLGGANNVSSTFPVTLVAGDAIYWSINYSSRAFN